MADPRLNSIHLVDDRRHHYRLAREVLLQAQGYRTLCAVQEQPAAVQSPTYLECPDGEPAPSTNFWLADARGIYPLKIGVNTVGRSVDNDVVVQDPCVSRRHCAILVHVGSGCELHDTASKNGTFVNGTRLVAPTRLQAGDEIRMCDQQYIFRARPGAADRPPDGDATFTQSPL